jgi:hypothetical protein
MDASIPGTTRARRLRVSAWLLLVPVVFVTFALVYPKRYYHWDVLERAWIIDFPFRYLHSFDGTPRSMFLHFAHPLELPLAVAFGAIVPGLEGMQLLRAFGSCTSVLVLWLAGWLVLIWRQKADRAALMAAMVTQATLAACLAFWKMGSAGEEKILGMAAQLLFLALFWRSLLRTDDDDAVSAARAAPWGMAAAGALVFAVLAHLTGAVLIPFAAIVLWRVRNRPLRRMLAIRLAVAVVVIGVAYVALAAYTMGARSPVDLWKFVTFYHAGKENFFEPTGAPQNPGFRAIRAVRGVAGFFSSIKWDGLIPAAIVAAWLAFVAIRNGLAPRAKTNVEGLPFGQQAAILAALWAAHFVFFEPDVYESWTLFVALGLVAAGVALPRDRRALIGFALPVFLIVVNIRHYQWNHRPLGFEPYIDAAIAMSRPNDLIVMVGGRQDGDLLRGSLWTRYAFAFERQRTIVSLYDVTGCTEPEYWGRPFTSADSLQAQIDAGRRAYAPSFIGPEANLLAMAGLLDVKWEARGDSVIEITHVREIPPEAALVGRLVTRNAPGAKRVGLLPYRKQPTTPATPGAAPPQVPAPQTPAPPTPQPGAPAPAPR